jgi:hypothetical protein
MPPTHFTVHFVGILLLWGRPLAEAFNDVTTYMTSS